MREYGTDDVVGQPVGNLADDLVAAAAERPDSAVVSRRVDGEWVDVSATEFRAAVRRVAAGLIASGVEAGDRVALMSRSRYEWTLLDYAIWYAGAITVPIYLTTPDETLDWILTDAAPMAIVVETAVEAARVAARQSDLRVWTIDDDAIGTLTALGEELSEDVVEARRADTGPDQVATVIYTSGATGKPKGCALTHRNFDLALQSALSELHELFDPDSARTLIVLPLAHVFARITQVGCVKAGVPFGHANDVRELAADLASYRPTFLLAVPKVFESLVNEASQHATAEGRGGAFARAVDVAIRWSQRAGGHRGPLLRAQYATCERSVYRPLREALGGELTWAISGGAPLGERLARFFDGIGVTLLEGYGLTETTGAITANTPAARRIGTVGRPLPGVTVRVSEEGELLVRSGQVFNEYWGDPEATGQAFTDAGWLRTGDLGEIDDDGFVRVTGRIQEVLVTAGGKQVSPTVLEERLRTHPLVDNCMLVGDRRPWVGALITLDTEAVSRWAEENDAPRNLRSLTTDSRLREVIQQVVDDANSAVSPAESIRQFVLLTEEWSPESGHLTPSLKLKRAEIARTHVDDIEALYVSGPRR